jgi:bifunctional enzyme CysN/CysC
MVCWFADRSTLTPGATYALRHTTRATTAEVRSLEYRLDVNALHRDESAPRLAFNEIGRVQLRTRQPVLFDPYRRNRATGSFILVDDTTNDTVAAGMVTGPATRVVWHAASLTRDERPTCGLTVWLTGLSASGKSTVAAELEHLLVAAGRPAYLLDGDNLRHGLNADLGVSAADRAENVRRVTAVAQLFADARIVAIVSFISPHRADRARARAAHADARLSYVEVFVDTPLAVCEARDLKGRYARARAGEIRGFTGIDDPYEAPVAPELVLRPGDGDPATMASAILTFLDR